MIREAPAVTVRQNLGELLAQVEYRRDAVVITKDGKPVAALVDYPLFERIRRMREEFDRLAQRLGQTYAGVDAAVADAEIGEAVRAARTRRPARRRKSR